MPDLGKVPYPFPFSRTEVFPLCSCRRDGWRSFNTGIARLNIGDSDGAWQTLDGYGSTLSAEGEDDESVPRRSEMKSTVSECCIPPFPSFIDNQALTSRLSDEAYRMSHLSYTV